MAELIVTVQHLSSMPSFDNQTGYCARGARAFAQHHGLDWAAFVAHGVAESVLVATGDALAMRLVQHARLEALRG
jgi:hypothetical protein